MLEKEFRDFLAAKAPEIARLSKVEALAYWQATTTGDAKFEQQYALIREELLKFLSDRSSFARLKTFKESGQVKDSLLKRQLDVLYNLYLENQIDTSLISELVQRETEIESSFTNFRAVYQGQEVSNNDIDDILRRELDSAKRREAWEASKQIGQQVADKVLEVVKLRNRIAKSLGFKNYQQMALELNEIDPGWLEQTLRELKILTDDPFAAMKDSVDKALKKRYGVEQLMPWHYSDPFFQEAPEVDDLDLNEFFKDKNVLDLVVKYYRGIGLDVTGTLSRSDLYERAGKNQHAFCTDIDREGDVRVLCNVRNDEYWMNTLLHELGHAVYDTHHDRQLPYLLRTQAHILTTEGIAMQMERRTKDSRWLHEIAGVPEETASQLQDKLDYRLGLGQLVFIRWGLVVVNFERELYANPNQDLTKLWWDLVEELQLVQRPTGRITPDWAAKIHIATAPIYYQNYILGALFASQIYAAMAEIFGSPLPVSDQRIGQFLITKVFNPGARYPWNEMINKATGEGLSPKFFADQFVQTGSLWNK